MGQRQRCGLDRWLGEEDFDGLGLEGFGEVEALTESAVQSLQGACLFGRFDALGHVGDLGGSGRRVVGRRCVGTKIGTPSWWSPFQRPARSKVRRPTRTAPVAINSSKISPLGPDGRNVRGSSALPSGNQACSRSPLSL